jgi:hypothetical protein
MKLRATLNLRPISASRSPEASSDHTMKMLAAAALVSVTMGPLVLAQMPGPVGCGTNIISSTVVSIYCGHREGDDEMLDLLVLWRGTPGWFNRAGGRGSSGGSSGVGAGRGTKGFAYQYSTYGDITIGVDLNFDANTAKIGEEVFALDSVNIVFIDGVGEPGGGRVYDTRWIEPKLPLVGDPNVLIAQRSREVVNYLRCDIPMPAPQTTTRMPPIPVPLVITVCERLQPK